MNLTESQKKHLKRLAHPLKPIVTVGQSGITPALTDELNRTLEHHELIKVKVRAGDRAGRDAAIDELVESSGATLVQRIGNTAVLFRQRRDNSAVSLPG